MSVLFEFTNGVSGTMGTIRATPQDWCAHVFGTNASAEAIGATELVVRRSGVAPQRLSVFDPVDALEERTQALPMRWKGVPVADHAAADDRNGRRIRGDRAVDGNPQAGDGEPLTIKPDRARRP